MRLVLISFINSLLKYPLKEFLGHTGIQQPGRNGPRLISLWRNVLLFWVGCLCYIPNTPLEINMPQSVAGRMLMLISLTVSKCATMGSPSHQATKFTRTMFKRNTEEALISSNSMTFWGIRMWTSQPPATTNMEHSNYCSRRKTS